MSTSPQVLDNYKLLDRLGQSDTLETWKAFDTQQRHYVAIKILHVNLQADPDFPARFVRELQRIASLHHPNIVRVRDFRIAHSSGSETPSTVAYIATDYVEGQTLADYIESTSHQGKFPSPPELVRLLIPISLAIDYAHQQGIIHGDIEPGNILLDKSNTSVNPMGQPALSDFGMAQILKPSPVSLLSRSFYTSPEQAQGYAANERSDLYSLGVIVYEMFTGVLPFQSDNPGDTLRQHMYATPTPPALINPSILPALTSAILRALAKDPAARFPSAAAMVVALANAIKMPLPENVKLAATSAEMNMPTYLSPLPSSRVPGITPSSPSLPGFSYAPTPPPASTSSTPAGMISNAGQVPQTLPDTRSVMNLPTVISSTGPTPVPQKPRRRGLYIALAAILIVALVLSGLGVFLRLSNFGATTVQTPVVGHAFFVSSGLLSLNSNQGITDEVQINLSNIPDPPPGKSYYAWLLSNQQINLPAILLGSGSLPLNHGQVTVSYINPQHDNLLANYNHFLITEENANPAPTNPSLDPSTWRYAAFFSTAPNPADLLDHFSLYDHLRHLLAQDPKLKLAGLTGGLDIWLYRNTSKILEAAGGARDSQPSCTPDPHNPGCAFVLREMVRILDYLDGINYVTRDLPPGTTPLYIDPVIARVALLEIDPVNQQPPGYLKHMGNHLRLITTSPGVTAQQRALAIRINQDINNVQGWLNVVHADAVKLVHMNNAQLSQPAALQVLDDLFTQANFAFVGQFDPNTGSVKEGAVQIHYNIQRLATFDVTPCTTINGKNSCA